MKRALTLSLLLVIGCSSTDFQNFESRLPSRNKPYSDSSIRAERLPWEVWIPNRDLKGGEITNSDIRRGDDFVSQGKRRDALDSYSKVAVSALSPIEYEALILRKAGVELAQRDSVRALKTISEYFQRSGRGEEEVSPEFGVLLAFAYGHRGDVDQSFAWFSRVYRETSGKGFGTGVARLGVKRLIYTLSTTEFEKLARDWRGDEFINGIIGEERFRRSERGYVDVNWDQKTPFWQSPIENGETPRNYGPIEAKVGVLVSLTDKFAALERSTRDGIQLAFDSDLGAPKYQLVVRDVGAGADAAALAVKELSTVEKVSAIVGPLITEAAKEAAKSARELGTPILTLSKSADFHLGGGVFQLGATTEAQLNALLSVSFGKYGLRRYGIVAPESDSAREFIDTLRRKASELNLSVVTEVKYGSDKEPLLIEAAKSVERTPMDALLVIDNVDIAARFLAMLSPSFRKQVRILGTATWDNPIKIANSQSLFEGALFVSPFFTLSSNPSVRAFIDSYKAKFGVVPNFLAAQGFDAAILVLATLRKAKTDGVAFNQAFIGLPPYDGLTGIIQSGPKGDIRRSFKIVEVTKTGLAEVVENRSR